MIPAASLELAVHIYPSSIEFGSRILRVTKAFSNQDEFDDLWILGTSDGVLPNQQRIDPRRTIVRIPRPYALPRGLRQRAVNTLLWSRRVEAELTNHRIKCVSAHSLAALPLAVKIKQRHQSALVYQPHELETESQASLGVRRWLARRAEAKLIKAADAVVCVSDRIADWYAARYGIQRPFVVRNIPDTSVQADNRMTGSLRRTLGIPADHLVFLYTGGLFEGRRIQQFIRVFTSITGPCHLVFVGYGPLEDAVKAAAERSPNIHFHPAVAPNEIIATVSEADVGLIGVENRCLSYYFSLPNKLFECMLAGVPAVIPNYPEIREVIERYQCGWIVGESDEDWKRAILSLSKEDVAAKAMGAKCAAAELSWRNEEAVLIRAYESAMNKAANVGNPIGSASRSEHGSSPVRCTRCVMDTSDPTISFDHDGVCSHCHAFATRAEKELLPLDRATAALEALVHEIKQEGRGKKYDVIIGVSGGVDSTSVALLVKKLGLRPLAVHLDNGWNAELAVNNIELCLKALDIDLYTYVVDWEEFRDIQLAMLKASIANTELVTDHAIMALLFQTAARMNIGYIISGGNIATEAVMPREWMYDSRDLRLIKSVHKLFGTKKMKTYPKCNLLDYATFLGFRRIKYVPILNYVNYNKEQAKRQIAEEVGWRDYGGKHYESTFTKFFQGYLLPKKFGIDKRKAHLSSLILSKQISREEALQTLSSPPLSDEEARRDLTFFLKKMRVSSEEFAEIMSASPKTFRDYPSNGWLFGRYSSRFFDVIKTLVRPKSLARALASDRRPPARTTS